MLFTSHVITGSAIGGCTSNQPIAFVGGFLSHHALDSIPHLDPGTFVKGNEIFKPVPLLVVGVDLTVGAIIFYFIWKYSGFSPSVLWGAIGAVLPDAVDNGPWRAVRKLPVFKQYHSLHQFFHSTVNKKNWLIGAVSQMVIIVLAILLIIYTSH